MALPLFVNHHAALLTLNSRDLPLYKDAIPGVPGVDAQPPFLDPHNGVWVVRVVSHSGVVLPTHYHTGTVHLWTLSGKWNYLEPGPATNRGQLSVRTDQLHPHLECAR